MLFAAVVACAAAAVIAAWAFAAAGGSARVGAPDRSPAAAARAPVVRIVAHGQLVGARRLPSDPAAARRLLASWLASVPLRRSELRRGTRYVYRVERARLLAAARRVLARGGGVVLLPERTVAASTRLPVVKQAFRNNCETAALSMLLVAAGVRASQLELQRRLPRSGPLDPLPVAGGLPVWGDPDRGFVGRVAGGGTSGGFGVYPGPVRRLARRYGVALTDLSGAKPAVLFRRLLAGRPVLAWVGLSAGPYRSWRTPSGRRITVNFGEHTVVLTGLRGQRVELNDPLSGTRASWTRAQFVRLWERLGRRALGI